MTADADIAPVEDKYEYTYLIAIAVTLAAVLESIDTSIVNPRRRSCRRSRESIS
jgi:hypothetical protein